MNTSNELRPRPDPARIILRSRIIRAIRHFFEKEGFIEVSTPLLVSTLAPEPHIEAFAVGDRFLITSPELNLKRLLAEGFTRIFQLGPVFRKGERGRYHLPEFTLLEWYRAGADYRDLMDDCERLLLFLLQEIRSGRELVYQGRRLDLSLPFERLSVLEAFERYAGWRPEPPIDLERFYLDLAEKVEPALNRDRPVFLYDYPAPVAALSRLKPGGKLAERVEFYLGGLELANGFSELTDPEEQSRRFQEDLKIRKDLGKPLYPWPEAFLKALAHCPEAAGMALGVDRLIMLFSDAASIDEVVAFVPEEV
ncbi:amino acid--tRNA ligase-related protein [Thermosulfuriphilus sp.]